MDFETNLENETMTNQDDVTQCFVHCCLYLDSYLDWGMGSTAIVSETKNQNYRQPTKNPMMDLEMLQCLPAARHCWNSERVAKEHSKNSLEILPVL